MISELDLIVRLREEAKQLCPVSAIAVEAYEDKREEMLQIVDQRLIAREDLRGLIGSNPISLMRLNHRHHVVFMSNVFRYSCFGLFAQVLAWVYRSYRHHGFATDYFPIELAAWREAVSTCLPEPLAVEIDAVYVWMMARHDRIAQASVVDRPSQVDNKQATACEDLTEELLAGNFLAGVRRMQPHLQDATTLAAFYQELLQPALYEVGRRWESGRITAADEHLATAVAERMLASAYVSMTNKLPQATRGSAVIVTAPDESHGIGGRMIADLLELKGWEVHFLGVNLPVADVAALVGKIRPVFVGISLVMPYSLRSTALMIEKLRDVCAESPPRILLGSPVLRYDCDLGQQLGADACVSDLRTALSVADGWR